MSLTHEIKTRVDDETGALLRRRATALGCPVGELVRDAIYMLEHGMTYGEYVAKHRRLALSRLGPIAAQEADAYGAAGQELGGQR